MKLFARCVIALVLVGLLAGCGAAPVREMEHPNAALLFGNLQAPLRLDDVYLHELGKPYIGMVNMPRARVYRNGNFVFENLTPGDYYLAGFADKGRIYWFAYDPASLRRALIKVRPGAVVYAGSYAVVNVESHRLAGGSFEIRLAAQPTERQVLQDLLPRTQGTGWEPRVRRQLSQAR